MIKTIFKENFLLPAFFDKLTKVIESQALDWHWEEKTVEWANDNHFMFTTLLYARLSKQKSNWLPIFEPILYFLAEEVKFKEVLKMKMNLYVNHTVQHVHAEHVDMRHGEDTQHGKKDTPLQGVITAVYNFTDCDGFTKIEDKKYTSKANSIIIFDGTKLHCGATPTNTKKRVVLNINVMKV